MSKRRNESVTHKKIPACPLAESSHRDPTSLRNQGGILQKFTLQKKMEFLGRCIERTRLQSSFVSNNSEKRDILVQSGLQEAFTPEIIRPGQAHPARTNLKRVPRIFTRENSRGVCVQNVAEGDWNNLSRTRAHSWDQLLVRSNVQLDHCVTPIHDAHWFVEPQRWRQCILKIKVFLKSESSVAPPTRGQDAPCRFLRVRVHCQELTRTRTLVWPISDFWSLASAESTSSDSIYICVAVDGP